MKRCLLLLMLVACWGHAGPAVTYSLPAESQVSLAIYDSAGRMMRELLRAVPQAAGQHQATWDGLDMNGAPVPAGDYEWRLLQTNGLSSTYVMSIGTSVGAQWWPGNHGGPSVVAAADDSFVVAAATEGPPEIIRCTFAGEVLWKRRSFEPARSPKDVAIAAGKVFYLQNSGKIQVLNWTTGESIGNPLIGLIPLGTFELGGLDGESAAPEQATLSVPNGDYFLRFHYGDPARATTLVEVNPGGLEPSRNHRFLPDKMRWWQLPATPAGEAVPIFLPQIYGNPRVVPVRDGTLRINFLPQTTKGEPVHWRVTAVDVMALPDCLAASAEELVLASAAARSVAWIDPVSGDTLDRLKLDGVRDLALTTDGQVLALLADRVVRFSREQRSPTTVVNGLQTPVSLAIRDTSGALMVLEGGSIQQVQVYDPQGQLLQTLGRAGGRQLGRYNPNDFAGVSALAADGHGGFLVTEQHGTPRRTARFDEAGKVVQEWFGGMDFYSQTEFDPVDPAIGWLRQDAEHIVQVRIDYKTRSWYPLAAFRWTELLDPTPAQAKDPLYTERTEYGPWLQRNPSHSRMRCLRHDLDGDGKPELLIEFTALPLLLVHDQARHQLRPLSALGLIAPTYFSPSDAVPVEALPAAWREAIMLAGGDPADVKERRKYARYSWADENGDGQIQAPELRLGEAHRDSRSPSFPNGGQCLRIDNQLAAWIGPGHAELGGLYRVHHPERYTACGAPVWPLEGEPGPLAERRSATASILPTRTDGLYLLLHGNGDGTRASFTYDTATHGWGWPGVMMDGIALLHLDATGEPLWRSGYKAPRWPHPRGQLNGAWHLMGIVNGCIGVADWYEQPCEFWTTDGLYVGGLFDGHDPMDGSLPGGGPDRLYTWHGIRAKRIGGNTFDESSVFAADDLRTGGSIARLPDGSVAFMGQGANNNPLYTISGFDGWQRQRGAVTVAQPANPAKANGAGLSATYFSTLDFAGKSHTRLDERLWFGIDKPWPGDTPEQDFSVRWTGFIEPRFSEDYCLSIYARGDFKLWIDGQEVTWAAQDYPREREIQKGHSTPISLTAGEKVSIRLEYRANMHTRAKHPEPSLHLNWESLSQPVKHIPTAFLYPNN